LEQTPSRTQYRPDIDGLRAIAVLAVVLFHVDANWLPGGFIGVDVFFVISGFLITRNLVTSMSSGTFTFADFYRRRIRRIIPAMIFVTAVTLFVGHFILLPDDLSRLSASAIATALSGANIFFTYFFDTSYFAPAANQQPLLHMWSLGVEEQFYLIWPAMLLLAFRGGRKTVLAVIGVVTVASFVLAWWVVPSQPMFAYYMLPTRAGQLLAGAFCVFVIDRLVNAGAMAAGLQAIGLGLIAASLIVLNHESSYPGLNAVPVTIGAALLILGGASTTGSVFSRTLSLTPMRWIGLISYSMYLWHWPVMAFARYTIGALDLLEKAAALLLIFALSFLSYRYVELPCRRTELAFAPLALRQLVLPVMLVCAGASALIASDGFGLYKFTKSYETFLQQEPTRAGNEPYVCQRTKVTPGYMRQPECIIGATYSSREGLALRKREPKILLWGDSNAAHYVGFVGEMASHYGFAFRNVSHGLCLPLLNEPERFAPSKRAEDCKVSAATVKERLWLYDTVIMSGAWRRPISMFPDFLTELERTIEELVTDGKRVILLGRVPYIESLDELCSRKALKLDFLDCRGKSTVDLADVEQYNGKLRSVAARAGAIYYDLTDLLCEDNTCSAYLDDQLIYRDPGHIGIQGSIALGRLARGNESTDAIFKPLAGALGAGKPASPPWR
jgi:peptidoglycan/LPS O-acetylase OafA/YrhL